MSPDTDRDNAPRQEEGVIPMSELTEREKLIAEKAAKLAVEMVMDEFYKGVGKSLIQRFLILLGAAAVGFAFARGWITLPK